MILREKTYKHIAPTKDCLKCSTGALNTNKLPSQIATPDSNTNKLNKWRKQNDK